MSLLRPRLTLRRKLMLMLRIPLLKQQPSARGPQNSSAPSTPAAATRRHHAHHLAHITRGPSSSSAPSAPCISTPSARHPSPTTQHHTSSQPPSSYASTSPYSLITPCIIGALPQPHLAAAAPARNRRPVPRPPCTSTHQYPPSTPSPCSTHASAPIISRITHAPPYNIIILVVCTLSCHQPPATSSHHTH